MDQQARLVKVMASVATFREDLDRLHAADERLADEIAHLREHTERALAGLRPPTDRGLAQRGKELNTSARWLIGLMLSNMSRTLGLIAKSAALF